MALTDALNMLADATDLSTSGTGTQNIGNVIDMDPARDWAAQGDYVLVVYVTTAFTTGTTTTVTFKAVSDSGTTPATDGSQTEHGFSQDFDTSALTLGEKIIIPLSYGKSTAASSTGYERYFGVQAVVSTAALTAGAITAHLLPKSHVSTEKKYADQQK